MAITLTPELDRAERTFATPVRGHYLKEMQTLKLQLTSLKEKRELFEGCETAALRKVDNAIREKEKEIRELTQESFETSLFFQTKERGIELRHFSEIPFKERGRDSMPKLVPFSLKSSTIFFSAAGETRSLPPYLSKFYQDIPITLKRLAERKAKLSNKIRIAAISVSIITIPAIFLATLLCFMFGLLEFVTAAALTCIGLPLYCVALMIAGDLYCRVTGNSINALMEIESFLEVTCPASEGAIPSDARRIIQESKEIFGEENVFLLAETPCKPTLYRKIHEIHSSLEERSFELDERMELRKNFSRDLIRRAQNGKLKGKELDKVLVQLGSQASPILQERVSQELLRRIRMDGISGQDFTHILTRAKEQGLTALYGNLLKLRDRIREEEQEIRVREQVSVARHRLIRNLDPLIICYCPTNKRFYYVGRFDATALEEYTAMEFCTKIAPSLLGSKSRKNKA